MGDAYTSLSIYQNLDVSLLWMMHDHMIEGNWIK